MGRCVGLVVGLILCFIFGRNIIDNFACAVLCGLDFICHGFIVYRVPVSGGQAVQASNGIAGLVCGRFTVSSCVIGGVSFIFGIFVVQITGGLHNMPVVCVLFLVMRTAL